VRVCGTSALREVEFSQGCFPKKGEGGLYQGFSAELLAKGRRKPAILAMFSTPYHMQRTDGGHGRAFGAASTWYWAKKPLTHDSLEWAPSGWAEKWRGEGKKAGNPDGACPIHQRFRVPHLR